MSPVLGAPMDRVDGTAKVTGQARYAADQPAERTAYAALVTSTIARGTISAIDIVGAHAAAGVLAVVTADNAPKLGAPPRPPWPFGQSFLPLQDNAIHHAGQIVAIVVAESLEQAHDAAALVDVTYSPQRPAVTLSDHLDEAFTPASGEGIEYDYRRGDTEAALRAAAVRHEATYTTSMQHHNPMETSATTAVWDADRLTLYDATQSVTWTRTQVASMLGVPVEKVRVVSPYLGGGFGCKGYVWPHTVLTAAVARQLGRPVKLVLTRAQAYGLHGHRAETIQHLRLGANHDGRLTALSHLTTSQTSPFDDVCWEETNGSAYVYQCPSVEVHRRIVRLNFGNPTPMRAPSGVGGFALESMIDELSYTVGVDPIELRLRNYSYTDQRNGNPWGTGKFLRDCYERGAALFGWPTPRPRPATTRRDGGLIGWGMATAFHPVYSSDATVSVSIDTDGRVHIRSATQDIGTGVYTVITQVVSQALGVEPADVSFELGDTDFPPGAPSAGSRTAVSVGGAAHRAATTLRQRMIEAAVTDARSPLHRYAAADVAAVGGVLQYRHDPRISDTYRLIAARVGHPIEVTGATTGTTSSHSWGAVFAEVAVNESTGETRVIRLTGAFDAGRILNPKTAASQATGGMIWGLGTALTEHTLVDPNSGRVVTANLSGYLVPVSADVPAITVEFIDRADPTAGILGARGNGELSPNGTTAAIVNAIYHATGRRIRELPVTPDKLLAPHGMVSIR